jgi:hypothetical protein
VTKYSNSLKEWLDAITGDEKFILVVGCGFVDTVLVWFGKIDQNNYVTLTALTIGAYLTGKAVEGIASTNADARVAVAKTEAMAAVSPPADPRAAAAALNVAVPTLQAAP